MRTRHKALLTCAALSAALCVAGDARAQGKEKSPGDKHAAPAKQEAAKPTATKWWHRYVFRPTATKAAAAKPAAKPAERRVARQDAPRAARTEPAKPTKQAKPAKVERAKVGQAKPAKPAKPAKRAKRVVTTDRAIVVTREVLVKHGYEVVRVETVRGARVVYYRRGNMGRGRGKGPIVRMVIRPVEERVVFEQAPRGLVAEINVRLGM